jgi:hypothetical protein
LMEKMYEQKSRGGGSLLQAVAYSRSRHRVHVSKPTVETPPNTAFRVVVRRLTPARVIKL